MTVKSEDTTSDYCNDKSKQFSFFFYISYNGMPFLFNIKKEFCLNQNFFLYFVFVFHKYIYFLDITYLKITVLFDISFFFLFRNQIFFIHHNLISIYSHELSLAILYVRMLLYECYPRNFERIIKFPFFTSFCNTFFVPEGNFSSQF